MIEGMKKQPAYTEDNPVMQGAFLACARWASGEKKFTDTFKEDTGYDLLSVIRSAPLESMIDEATGYTKTVFFAWLDWVSENVWGEEGEEDDE